MILKFLASISALFSKFMDWLKIRKFYKAGQDAMERERLEKENAKIKAALDAQRRLDLSVLPDTDKYRRD
jgi:hypothetical protein